MVIGDVSGFSFLLFSDESNYNNSYYASICSVSLKADYLEFFEEKLLSLLKESNVEEISWKNLRGAKERFCCEKILKFIFDNIDSGNFRIDIIIWDMKRRKEIHSEGDIKILGRMYHHLFKNVSLKRWEEKGAWKFFPDRHTALNWRDHEKILDVLAPSETISISEVDSKEYPICQVADLFGGIGSFSWINAPKIKGLVTKDQKTLDDSKIPFSGSELEKIQVCKWLEQNCKKRGIEITRENGFQTKNPNLPINFWFFKQKDYRSEVKLSNYF